MKTGLTLAERQKEKFLAFRIRTCRTLHHCEICGCAIVMGDNYHDGGYGNRAHVDCVKGLASEPKVTP